MIGAYNSSNTGTLSGPGQLVKTGNGNLLLESTNTYTGGTNVSAGELTFVAAAALPVGSNVSISPGAEVFAASNLSTSTFALNFNSLTNAGLLDVGKNAAIIHSGSTLSLLTSQVAQTYNSGAFNGTTGITSSAAAADSTHLTAVGVIVNDNGSGTPLYGSGGSIASTFEAATPVDGDLLVKYTYFGDANLDGKVDGSDYSLIDSGYLSGKTGWYNGDFNYDGVVNGSDYTLIDNAFNTQGAVLAAESASPLAAVSTAQIAAVPEPATLGLIALGTVGLLGSRRRRQ